MSFKIKWRRNNVLVEFTKESISSQLEDTNSVMAGLTDVKNGKMLQWTAQSKLGDVRSRKDFLQQNKNQTEKETKKFVLELHEFDSSHRSSLEQIRNIFATTKTKYERLLQNSIYALESVVGSDVEDTTQTDATCADRIYFMKSNLWETFDDKHQMGGEAKGSYGDGRSDCNNDAHLQSTCLSIENTNAGLVDKTAQTCKHDKKSQGMKERVSMKKHVSVIPDSLRGFLPQSPSPNISDSTSEETIVLGKYSVGSLPSSENSRFPNPFNDNVNCTLGRKSTHSVNSKPSNHNATKLGHILQSVDEDRTNNHDLDMLSKFAQISAETPEKIPTDDSPNVLLIYSKREKPVCHSRCSSIRDDIDILGRDAAREKEEEAINKYFNKYLLRLGRCGVHSFERSESRCQSIQSWPEMLLSDKKMLDEKAAQPILISLSKESNQKFEVCTVSHADICDHNLDSYRQVGLCLSNSSDRCSEKETSKNMCLNNLSRDKTPTDEPKDSNPNQSDAKEYNISHQSNSEKVSNNDDSKHNIGVSQYEELFDTRGDCNMEANIRQNSNEPDIPSDCFDGDWDEGGVSSGCTRSKDVHLPIHRQSRVSYCQPDAHRYDHRNGVEGNHALGEDNVPDQINSFLALMTKETKAVLNKLESECSNMFTSDSESPSTATSLSCSSTTPGVFCPDTIPGAMSTHGQDKSKGPSCHKRVRFNEEIEYSGDLDHEEERDFCLVLGDDLNDDNNTPNNDNNNNNNTRANSSKASNKNRNNKIDNIKNKNNKSNKIDNINNNKSNKEIDDKITIMWKIQDFFGTKH